jgi:hypothetical protein
MLRLRGALGPLQSGAVDGTLTFEFKHTGDASAITVSYLISGYFAGGLDKLAQGVDGVLGAQMKRLQRFVDGAPVAATEAH